MLDYPKLESFFTTRENGMGMGLSIAKTVVESYAGEIKLANTEHGAEVMVQLPCEARRHD